MPRRVKVCQQAVRSVVEALEGRVLLTTIMGGGVDPVTGDPIANTLLYFDANKHVNVISVGGNTTAEFIFARVPDMQGRIASLGDRVPPPPPDAQDVEGKDLFSIYVSESDSRSFISVCPLDEGGNLVPFTGNAGSFTIINASTGQLTAISPDDGTGTALLGARSKAQGPTVNMPIVSRSFSGALGVRPDLGRVTAGLQVADGLDFGKFFFGGVVTGQVIVPGSMESFYAGSIWTGDARGVGIGTQTILRGKRVPNFSVGGNLNSISTAGSIGTENDAALDQPDFYSGFEMQVGGVLGQVKATDSVLGGINAVHGSVKSPYGAAIQEVEGRQGGFIDGLLTGATATDGQAVFNDSFTTEQMLPSFAGKRHRSSVIVSGALVASPITQDYQDYYGMPMLAGQDLTVTLRPVGTGADNMNVGIFDPDGRLVITDYPNVDPTAVTGQPIHFTADRPGVYRIAVATAGNGTFTGAGSNIGFSPYTLTINGGGDLGLGGIEAGQQIFDAQAGGYGVFVQNGDMGAEQAGGTILSVTDQSIYVRKGNLRSVEGGALGGLAGTDPVEGPNLFVTRGNVGLVRSTAASLSINNGVIPLAIGGDYQVVSAATTFGGTLLTNRAIGVIRAGSMATNAPSVITANADELGDDGIIDLIDVAGDLGTANAGGPAITTGPGGNLRYFNVGGQVFRDVFFGGGLQEATTYDPGEKVTLRDDSGTTMNFTPFPIVQNPAFVPGGTNPATIAPSLTITAYGIRGSGGVAVINLTSTGSVEVGAGGGRGSASHAEIGLLQTSGTGNPVIRNTNDGSLVFTFPTNNRADTNSVNLDVLLDGSGTLDVFKIDANSATSIRNQTAGEILNIDALGGTIGSLEATNIGVGVNHTGAAVNPIQVIGNTYPFNQQHNGVVSGNILNVEAAGAVGNLNVTGFIGNVTANSGGRHSTGMFEGIAGPIVASQGIVTVDIGDGILPSGSGNFSKAGIYAGQTIGDVVNRGLGSDIRGDIIAGSNIASISLHDGAIIGARIMVASTFTAAERFAGRPTLPDSGDTTTTPVFEIQSISTSGQGGIIGSDIEAADIGDINAGGFGIFNSFISDRGDGTINSIHAAGYGIRGVNMDGGALLNSVSATAKPGNISTANFTPSVRESERYAIDPFFDQAPSRETDLHIYLGTSARHPKAKRVTDTGVIADTTATANRNAGSIFASQIRSSIFNIANQIASIETRGVVDGLNVTTGRLKSFVTGDSIFSTNFSIAGSLDSFHVVGDVDDTSNIKALGPSAKITDFVVDGSLNGDVSSANNLHQLLIGKDLSASALVKAKTLDTKRIRGDVLGTIQVG